MKINNFRGDLTDNSAKKEALVLRNQSVPYQTGTEWVIILTLPHNGQKLICMFVEILTQLLSNCAFGRCLSLLIPIRSILYFTILLGLLRAERNTTYSSKFDVSMTFLPVIKWSVHTLVRNNLLRYLFRHPCVARNLSVNLAEESGQISLLMSIAGSMGDDM